MAIHGNYKFTTTAIFKQLKDWARAALSRVRQCIIHHLVWVLLKLEGFERNQEYRRRAALRKALALLEEGEEEQELEQDPPVSPEAEDTDPSPNSVRVGRWRVSPAESWDVLTDSQKDVFKRGLQDIERRFEGRSTGSRSIQDNDILQQLGQ